MSLYPTNIKIDGIICGLVMRGGLNGQYMAIFEREFASLEDIEGIDWSKPTIEGETVLPEGYGFDVANIQYDMGTRSYKVFLKTASQYLGDVVAYQAQVSELEATITEKDQDISNKEATIQSQTQQIQEKDATIQSQAQAIQTKDETIQSQEQEIQTKDQTIAEQTQTIQSKDETIATQEATIEQLESEGSAVELKGDLADAYTRGVESNG